MFNLLKKITDVLQIDLTPINFLVERYIVKKPIVLEFNPLFQVNPTTPNIQEVKSIVLAPPVLQEKPVDKLLVCLKKNVFILSSDCFIYSNKQPMYNEFNLKALFINKVLKWPFR